MCALLFFTQCESFETVYEANFSLQLYSYWTMTFDPDTQTDRHTHTHTHTHTHAHTHTHQVCTKQFVILNNPKQPFNLTS